MSDPPQFDRGCALLMSLTLAALAVLSYVTSRKHALIS